MRKTTTIAHKSLSRDFTSLVRMHPPAAIHDEVAYANTMEIIDALTSLPKLSKDQMRYLDTLSILAEAYEGEHHQLDVSDISPIDALSHLMDAHGMNASDLGRLLGERSLGPKILSGQRQLSKAHIRKLSEHFGVQADLFL